MKACGLKGNLHVFLKAAIDGGKGLRNGLAPLRTKKIGRYTLKNQVWGGNLSKPSLSSVY